MYGLVEGAVTSSAQGAVSDETDVVPNTGCARSMSFQGPWGLGSLNPVEHCLPESQAVWANSKTLFHHEIVMRF